MKLQLVMDAEGKIVGTARVEAEKSTAQNAPSIGQFTALPGQTVFEVELPSELQQIEDVEEFHKAVKKHLRQSHAKK